MLKLLLDMNLSPQLVPRLVDAGYECVYWQTVGAADAEDMKIVEWAKRENRTIVTNDSDFTTILATTGETAPSVMLVRCKDLFARAVFPCLATALKIFERDYLRGRWSSLTRIANVSVPCLCVEEVFETDTMQAGDDNPYASPPLTEKDAAPEMPIQPLAGILSTLWTGGIVIGMLLAGQGVFGRVPLYLPLVFMLCSLVAGMAVITGYCYGKIDKFTAAYSCVVLGLGGLFSAWCVVSIGNAA